MYQTTLQSIRNLAQSNSDIAVVWLYGSRAKGSASEQSDYDLAVAFVSFIKDDPIEKRLRPECLAIDWQRDLGLRDFKLSIVDIKSSTYSIGVANHSNGSCFILSR